MIIEDRRSKIQVLRVVDKHIGDRLEVKRFSGVECQSQCDFLSNDKDSKSVKFSNRCLCLLQSPLLTHDYTCHAFRGNRALIEYNGVIIGSGALVSPKFVLTAASIFQARMLKDLDKMTVFLGKHKTTVHSESHEKIFNVKVVHFHIRYNIPTIHNNDLALIELKTPAEDKYRPICLPQRKKEYFPNTVLTIAGWGGDQERIREYLI
ncbi:UNVERIFIED_CONTAM: Tmprss6 [Trichonephila clavipes]